MTDITTMSAEVVWKTSAQAFQTYQSASTTLFRTILDHLIKSLDEPLTASHSKSKPFLCDLPYVQKDRINIIFKNCMQYNSLLGEKNDFLYMTRSSSADHCNNNNDNFFNFKIFLKFQGFCWLYFSNLVF